MAGVAIAVLGVMAIFVPFPAESESGKSESFIQNLKNAHLVMIASSLCNYTILSASSKMTATGVIMMNIVITVIGVVFAIFVNVRYGVLLKNVESAK